MNAKAQRIFWWLFRLVLAPTYLFAEHRKLGLSKGKRASLIKRYNKFHFWMSLALLAFVGATDVKLQWNNYEMADYEIWYIYSAALLIWVYPFSRCNEVFYSFIQDAMDKVGDVKPTSALLYSDRIKLALRSYVELVVNFAIIYIFLPQEWFCSNISNIGDALYYSGVTITTLGYGDISPHHWVPQFLSVYEVFCGFILLIVSFTIYTGRGLQENKKASVKPVFRRKKRMKK